MEPLSSLDFIMSIEDGSITEEEFQASVQQFVDSNIWMSLQGFWQRSVRDWIESGIVTR